jgi:carboxylesterase
MQEGNSHGILLLHGFGDTPQTLELLAKHLHAAGFDVRAPLLPGHGTNVADFQNSNRSQWLACAREEYALMRSSHDVVSVAGLSMGGALAAIIASESPEISALVLIAPYLDMPLTHKAASATYWLWGRFAGMMKGKNPRSILDPAERAKNLGYGVYSGRLVFQLWRLVARAQASLRRISAPTLIVQSRHDPRIAPSVAEYALGAIGAAEKKLVWVEGGHIVTVDYGRDKVFGEVTRWIDGHAPGKAMTA